jgi:hypothetical protein
MGKWFVVMGLTAFVLAASGCDDEKSISCKGAMDNLYDAECAIFSDGYMVSEDDAVDGCEDTKDDAKDEDCYSEFKELLNCLNDIEDGDCEDCNGEWTDLYTCMGYY